MKLDKNNIYEYINKLSFDEGYELIRDLVNIINTNTNKDNSYKLIKIEPEVINPYIIDVSLKDIRENFNYGSFLLDRLENQKRNESEFTKVWIGIQEYSIISFIKKVEINLFFYFEWCSENSCWQNVNINVIILIELKGGDVCDIVKY